MTIWDEIFASRRWGRWPAEEVVRTVARLTRDRRCITVLEVGCGGGAQLWYLESEGHHAVGLDLSRNGLVQATELLTERTMPARLVQSDAAQLPFRSGSFDLVIDAEAFAHNHERTTPQLWREAARVLRKAGHLLSMGFTDSTFGSRDGTNVGTRTYENINEGPLAGVGVVALTDEHVAASLAAQSGLEIVDAQRRSRTVGPQRWLIDEAIILARRT